MTEWLDVVAGVAFFASAAAALRRSRRAALLSAVAGAAWFAGDLSVQASLLHRPLMLHAALAFPAVRLSRMSSVAVGVAWIGAVIVPVGQEPWLTLGLAAVAGGATWDACIDCTPVERQTRAWTGGTLVAAFALAAASQALPPGSALTLDVVPLYYGLVASAGAVLTFGFLRPPTGDGAEAIIELSEVDPVSALAALRREVSSAGAHESTSLTGAIELLKDNIDLRARLAERAEQVHASRRRLVEAGLIERQRLGALLAGGVQAHLDELGGILGVLSGDGPAYDLAQQSRTEVSAAKEDIEQVSRGLHPRLLAESGLKVAIEDLVTRCPFPVTVSTPARRFDSLVESTIWYTCAEALTNCAKYAMASRASVEASYGRGGLTITIADDGIGGAKVEPGGGLAGLTDRLAAVDGQLSVRSPLSGGVEVTAWVPC